MGEFDFFAKKGGRGGKPEEVLKRPSWAGTVDIKKIKGWRRQPVLIIDGPIIPTNWEGDRPPTPLKTFDGTKDNVGGVTGHEKGHFIALELGGPNDKFNIGPQPAGWQNNGHWRIFEKKILALAMKYYGWKDKKDMVLPGSAEKAKKPKHLLNIHMEILFREGNTKDKNVPRKYKGYLEYGGKKMKFSICQPKPVQGTEAIFSGELIDCPFDEGDTEIFYDDRIWKLMAISLLIFVVFFCECFCFGICMGFIWKQYANIWKVSREKITCYEQGPGDIV